MACILTSAFHYFTILIVLSCLVVFSTSRQTKSSVIMFDTLGTLCDVLYDDVASDPQLCGALLPPLLTRWEATADTDPLLFPLFECLASVAAAAKLQFQAYALPVLQRCCRLIEVVLVADATGQVTKEDERHTNASIHDCLVPSTHSASCFMFK